jgi:hypothetical protein
MMESYRRRVANSASTNGRETHVGGRQKKYK